MPQSSWYNAERVRQPGSVVLARHLPELRASNERRRADRNVRAAFGENTSTTNLTSDELARLLGVVAMTAAGVQVTPDTAGRVATVYGCVALLAGTVAGLPLAVYERRDDDGRDKAAGHDYWWLLNERAADGWSAFSAWEYMVAARLFYGDAFAEILRASPFSNRIVGWRPLHPDNVQPFRADGVLHYRVTDGGKQRVVDAADILHVPSVGFDGLRSPSPITYAAREAVGSAIASEEYSARFYRQGATFDYALTTDAALTKDQIDVLRESLLARYGGASNSRVPLILSGGLKPNNLSITPNDAALLPTRRFTVEEICRIFGVPPHMVGHTEKTTSWGTGLAEQGSNFVRYVLRRHLRPIEQEINHKFWPSRARFFVEYVTEALEFGDLTARSNAYRVALGRAGEPGWMTVNEVRRIENLPPVAGGDRIATAAAQQEPAQ